MQALIALILIAGACVLPTAGAAGPDSLPQATDWKLQFGAGYLFELEFGANEALSIVATAESLPVDLFENGAGCDSDCTESTALIAGAIIRSYSVGAKFAGRDAPVTAAIVLVGAALYAAAGLVSW